jgi:hypothetical protein
MLGMPVAAPLQPSANQAAPKLQRCAGVAAPKPSVRLDLPKKREQTPAAQNLGEPDRHLVRKYSRSFRISINRALSSEAKGFCR